MSGSSSTTTARFTGVPAYRRITSGSPDPRLHACTPAPPARLHRLRATGLAVATAPADAVAFDIRLTFQ
jgi:hypothetical protein